MITITDLLIIDHLNSVSVTLPYLPLVFRHLLTIIYLKFEEIQFTTHCWSKIAGRVADSVDPDETPLGLHCFLRLV